MGTVESEIQIDNGPPMTGVVSVEVEQIDVTGTKVEPDPKWEHIDAAGHFHAFDKDGQLPTLVIRTEHVSVPATDDDDGDWEYGEEWDYDVTTQHCVICGEQVEPKWKSIVPTYREYAPGRKSWSVEVDGDIERDKRVSVRVNFGQSTWFGVAMSLGADVSAEFGETPVFRTRLVGIGPLGERKQP